MQIYEEIGIQQNFFRFRLFRGEDESVFWQISWQWKESYTSLRAEHPTGRIPGTFPIHIWSHPEECGDTRTCKNDRTSRLVWIPQNWPGLKDLYKYVTTANNHIKRRGETVTIDKINGELTLGFWVSLFNAEYEKVLWKDLRKVFPNMPKSIRQRKNVSAPLNTLCALRNRVFHNENISWSLVKLEELHSLLIQVIDWMNPKVTIWMKCVDRFNKVIRKVRYQWYGCSRMFLSGK